MGRSQRPISSFVAHWSPKVLSIRVAAVAAVAAVAEVVVVVVDVFAHSLVLLG